MTIFPNRAKKTFLISFFFKIQFIPVALYLALLPLSLLVIVISTGHCIAIVSSLSFVRESDGMALPLAIIVAVFCIIAITFLGLGAKLLYQHCFGNLGAFGNSNGRTGVGTDDSSRRAPLSPNRFQCKHSYAKKNTINCVAISLSDGPFRCSEQGESLALRSVPLSPRTPLR